MINYLINFFLCLVTFILNMFFLYCNKKEEIALEQKDMDIICDNV